MHNSFRVGDVEGRIRFYALPLDQGAIDKNNAKKSQNRW